MFLPTPQVLKRLLTSAMICMLAATSALAADPATHQDAKTDSASATDASLEKVATGPGDIKLIDQAVLHVPSGYQYLSGETARKALRAMGNPHVDDVLAMVLDAEHQWFAVVQFEKSGYIKDDDARDWKVDELLESIRKGTEESNKARAQSGIPELEIIGWIEKPTYDAGAHRLVWSISAKDKGAANKDAGINYNTYALGREGYFSVNLVTDAAKIEQFKPTARTLLSSLEFNDGKRYTDFNASTDHVAEYGLAALVAGVAAKKLGLLALAGAFFVKFAKLIVIGFVAVVAGIKNFFKRGS